MNIKKRDSVALDLPAFNQFSGLSRKWDAAPWMARRALVARDGSLARHTCAVVQKIPQEPAGLIGRK